MYFGANENVGGNKTTFLQETQSVLTAFFRVLIKTYSFFKVQGTKVYFIFISLYTYLFNLEKKTLVNMKYHQITNTSFYSYFVNSVIKMKKKRNKTTYLYFSQVTARTKLCILRMAILVRTL